MKFEQIRNATIVLEYADKKFLVDPWLAPQGSNGTFKELGMEKEVISSKHNELAMPICSLIIISSPTFIRTILICILMEQSVKI